jgi:hypothetical protein
MVARETGHFHLYFEDMTIKPSLTARSTSKGPLRESS